MCICAVPPTPIEGVTVYARPEWPDYQRLRSFFEDRGIFFEHENIGTDPVALERMHRLSGQTDQAVVKIGDAICVGYAPDAIAQLLP